MVSPRRPASCRSSVEIESLAGLEVGSVTWPVPHRLALPGLGDEMWVHDGTVRGTLPLTFTGAPGGRQPRHRHPRGLSGV